MSIFTTKLLGPNVKDTRPKQFTIYFKAIKIFLHVFDTTAFNS